jgi:Ca-activated chloride channel family protein
MKTTLFLDYPTILVNQSRPVHCAIQFQAEKFLNPRPQPAAFCIVLDRSGSMSGKPLSQAKEAAKLAVRNLRTNDEFALVVFASEARTVVPLQQVKNKADICATIDKINDGDSTNLTAGWMLGKDELAKSNPAAARRLLLLSDGQLNHGIVDPTAVRQIVVSGLEHERVRTSCLGFGEGYNEDLMAELARATNGQFYDAQSPEKLPAIFASELDGLQKICVQNLRIRFKNDTFCERFALLGEYSSLALPDGRMEYAVGDLVSEEERIVCFEVKVLALPLINGQPAFKLEGEPLIQVEVVWDEITEKGVVSRTLLQTVVIQATQNPAEVLVNSVVAPWVSLQKAGAVAVEVNKQMDAGNPAAAVALIESVIRQLQAYGTQADEAIKVLGGMKNKIVNHDWDESARKQSRYSSASYRKMSSKEMWSGANDQKPSFKK